MQYRSQKWTLSKQGEYSLLVFKRKAVKRIFGPAKEGEAWTISTNMEIYVLYSEADIDCINFWPGMEDAEILNKELNKDVSWKANLKV